MCASCQKVDFKVACFPRKFRAPPGSLISPTVHSAGVATSEDLIPRGGHTEGSDPPGAGPHRRIRSSGGGPHRGPASNSNISANSNLYSKRL